MSYDLTVCFTTHCKPHDWLPQGRGPANRDAAAAAAENSSASSGDAAAAAASAAPVGGENVAAAQAAGAAGDEMMPGMAFMMDAYEQARFCGAVLSVCF